MPKSKNWEKRIADGPPCVVLASPGFMQSGTSRMFLEMWAPDPRNGCIVTGYSVEGTLARVRETIKTQEGQILTHRPSGHHQRAGGDSKHVGRDDSSETECRRDILLRTRRFLAELGIHRDGESSTHRKLGWSHDLPLN